VTAGGKKGLRSEKNELGKETDCTPRLQGFKGGYEEGSGISLKPNPKTNKTESSPGGFRIGRAREENWQGRPCRTGQKGYSGSIDVVVKI